MIFKEFDKVKLVSNNGQNSAYEVIAVKEKVLIPKGTLALEFEPNDDGMFIINDGIPVGSYDYILSKCDKDGRRTQLFCDEIDLEYLEG